MTTRSSGPKVEVRALDPERDLLGLWQRKREFELGIGADTGSDDKGAVYEAKLTETYRDRWLDWVERCVAEDPGCVIVAVEGSTAIEASPGGEDGNDGNDNERPPESVVGYAFVLPETLSFIWDAAVLNELFLDPDYRGTGVADDLMDAVLACARSQDLPLDRLVLDVDRENDRARSFYARYGFEHWGEMVARKL